MKMKSRQEAGWPRLADILLISVSNLSEFGARRGRKVIEKDRKCFSEKKYGERFTVTRSMFIR